MDSNPFLGVLFHAIGGFAAGSFYLPLKQIRNWAWESGWLVNGFFSWIIAPMVVALLSVPLLFSVLLGAPPVALMWTFFFGVLWGIGGLTFGLSVRYLGMSLGYGVALGFCAAFGTLIPAIHDGSIIKLLTTMPGWVVLLHHEGLGDPGRADCTVWPTAIDPVGSDRFDMNIVDVTPDLLEELAEVHGLI